MPYRFLVGKQKVVDLVEAVARRSTLLMMMLASSSAEAAFHQEAVEEPQVRARLLGGEDDEEVVRLATRVCWPRWEGDLRRVRCAAAGCPQ